MTALTPPSPYVTSITVNAGTSAEQNVIDFSEIKGQNITTSFLQITNDTSPGSDIEVYLNALGTPFLLKFGSTQIFNQGDLGISKVSFANTYSGNNNTVIDIIAGLPNN